MYKLIVLFLFIGSCKLPMKQTYNSEVKNLFFGADINGPHAKNLNYLRGLNYLKEVEPEGYTIYPPLSALGQDVRDTSFRSFSFEDHVFESELGSGRLNIMTGSFDKHVLSKFVLYFKFTSKLRAEKTYEMLSDKFTGLSDKAESSQFPGLKYIECYDSSSNFPGLRISLDYTNEKLKEYILTISEIT